MFEKLFDSPIRIQELRDGTGGRLIEGFAREMFHAGYAERTARRHIRAAEHLIYWTDQEGTQISSLDERVVEAFAHHLNRCRCPGYNSTLRQDLQNSARLFVGYLRRAGGLATSIAEPTAQAPVLLVSFCKWMRQQRGTCDSTLCNYARDLRALLNCLGEEPASFEAQSLRKFVLERSQRLGWGAAKRCNSAVRMFLRFLIADGKCTIGLDAAIPALRHWRLSSLPRYLQPNEVELVIASCDPATQVGRRDRAILLLLARMGLRAGDIVQLRLSDVDWEEAWISVSGKGRRQTRLPLTQEIGNAIASYIKDGQPQSESDALFLRVRAPFRAFRDHSAVSVLVAQAMRRAGVTCPSRGAAHVLRHSAASSMLRHGASLQEIAAILRHRSIRTTEIYAKVDVIALRQIAQSWPEVEPC